MAGRPCAEVRRNGMGEEVVTAADVVWALGMATMQALTTVSILFVLVSVHLWRERRDTDRHERSMREYREWERGFDLERKKTRRRLEQDDGGTNDA